MDTKSHRQLQKHKESLPISLISHLACETVKFGEGAVPTTTRFIGT